MTRLVVTVACLLVTACNTPGSTADSPAVEMAAEVAPIGIDVIDGDSFADDQGNEFRLAGVNAPEVDECLSEAARSHLESFTGDTLRVESPDPAFDQFDRRLVFVFAGTAETFVNQSLVAAGLAIPLHTDPSGEFQLSLFAAREAAADEGVGLWDPSSCGEGPLPDIVVARVEADPPGPDEASLDLERVVLENRSDTGVDLSGWSLRDESSTNRFRFPDGFELEAEQTVTVTSGAGELGFGLGHPVWNNTGDSVILVDDQGRFVAYSAYPPGGD